MEIGKEKNNEEQETLDCLKFAPGGGTADWYLRLPGTARTRNYHSTSTNRITGANRISSANCIPGAITETDGIADTYCNSATHAGTTSGHNLEDSASSDSWSAHRSLGRMGRGILRESVGCMD